VVAILSRSKILSACRPSYGKHRLWQVESNAIKFDSSSDPQSPPSRNVSFDRFFWDGVIYVAWALQFGRKVIGRRYVAGRRSDGVLFRDEIHFEI
jgi:hypothetical protein